MNDYAFYQCKHFLEQRMQDLPENSELIKAYVVLIEQKTKFDIAYFSQTSDVQKNWSDNHAKIATKQIEVGERSNNHGM